jgi:hypothetical protein
VLKEYLRHSINEDQGNWDEWAPCAVHVYNVSTHTSTGYTPFELVYVFKATMPSVLQENPNVQYNYDDFVTELSDRLQTAHQVAWENLINSKERSSLVKWDLWWTKWHRGRFSPSTSVSPAIHSTKFSILTITWGRYNRPVSGRHAEWTQFGLHPPLCKLKKKKERSK